MSRADRIKWDERYRAGAYADREYPTPLLAEWEQQISPGRALDVASGAGRNSIFLAAKGWQVDAVDVSPVGLTRAQEKAAAQNLGIRWIEADLEQEPGAALPPGPYDLIVMVRYVNAALYPHLLERLAPGGVFLCEEHLVSAEDVIGPANMAYRMQHNELLDAVTRKKGQGDRLLHYQEGIVTDPDGRKAALAQLVLRRAGAAAESQPVS
jgi:SAM-dependent methyltransferase